MCTHIGLIIHFSLSWGDPFISVTRRSWPLLFQVTFLSVTWLCLLSLFQITFQSVRRWYWRTCICIIPKSPFSLLQGGSDFIIPDHLSVSYNVMLTFTIPGHIFSCYQLYGSEGSCTTDIQLDYRLKDKTLTLTFPNASREDGGLYTLEMHVNDTKLNTTSCTLNIQERSGTYLVPLYSYQNAIEYLNNYIAMRSTRWTLNHLGQMHCFNSAHFSSE